MVENPMVSGYGYPSDPEPVATCEECGTDMFCGNTRYRRRSLWVCDECLEEEVLGMNADQLACEFDIETEEIE